MTVAEADRLAIVIQAVEHCAGLAEDAWPDAARLLRCHAATLRLAMPPAAPPCGKADVDPPAAAAVETIAAPRRAPPPKFQAAVIAEVERRWLAGETATVIAPAVGLTRRQVENMIQKRGWRRGRAPMSPRGSEPSVAARELAEQAAASVVAPADFATIRSWGAANGVQYDPMRRPRDHVLAVNARRRALGLPPFELVSRPLGALPADELVAMRVAGAATA